MRARGRRYDDSERLIVIQRGKLRIFGAAFTAGIAAAISLLGLAELCGCL